MLAITRVFVAIAASLLFASALLQIAAAQQKSITIFAAASMKNALDDIDDAYSRQSGVKIVASYAASSALMKQIEQGAPADVFVSADLKWMDYGAERKLINTATRINLLGNRLVLIAPKDSKIGTVTIAPVSTSPHSPVADASPLATYARYRPDFMPKRHWKNSVSGPPWSRNWQWPRMCAPR